MAAVARRGTVVSAGSGSSSGGSSAGGGQSNSGAGQTRRVPLCVDSKSLSTLNSGILPKKKDGELVDCLKAARAHRARTQPWRPFGDGTACRKQLNKMAGRLKKTGRAVRPAEIVQAVKWKHSINLECRIKSAKSVPRSLAPFVKRKRIADPQLPEGRSGKTCETNWPLFRIAQRVENNSTKWRANCPRVYRPSHLQATPTIQQQPNG